MSPSSGSGTGTPIGSVLAAAPGFEQALPATLLSLPRWARILGLNPVHFYRAAAPGLSPVVMPTGPCTDLWAKYDWQNADRASWQQLAVEIAAAESEIAALVGYWPAPVWMAAEPHPYPRPFERSATDTGRDLRGRNKTLAARWGKVVEAGQRVVAALGSASTASGSLAYSDQDGDGLFETAVVTFPTTLTDLRQIHVYFSGHAGDPAWEVRSPRRVTLSGGFVTFTYDAWQLLEPELFEAFPTDAGVEAIDISTTANYVAAVDLAREYPSSSLPAAVFTWDAGTACQTAACATVTQDGCLTVNDAPLGLVCPHPAAYDAAAAAWTPAAWAGGSEPDQVHLYYRAGECDPAYSAGISHDPLSPLWAQTIAWLATARLERPLCGCGAAKDRADELREELTYHQSSSSYFVTEDVLTSPFGTRRGEVLAWRRIKRLVRDQRMGVAVL